MGVNIREIVNGKEVELKNFVGKKIAIDAFNALYQFLAIIRQKDGTPLMDSNGRITSHLSGLFYRTINLLENGMRPVYVFDGKPPEFKKKEIEKREELKEEYREKYINALKEGKVEEMRTYAQATTKLTKEMVEEAKELLDYMGIPYVQAPSEGEAQAAYMNIKGDVYAAASQDYDSLLFGANTLVRNLTISGKRKLPRKNIYVEVKPEIIELKELLNSLGINREQLIVIGLLVGTDYNPGIKGIGPKKALDLVRRYKDVDKIMKVVNWNYEINYKELIDWFLNPDVTDNYRLEWKDYNEDKIIKFLCDEREFSEERVKNALSRIKKKEEGFQQSLTSFF